MSALRFEWDARKAATNRRKHGVSFDEASTVFDDPNVLLADDVEHSTKEDRLKAIGFSKNARLLSVVFRERDDVFRIISARKSDAKDEADYASNFR